MNENMKYALLYMKENMKDDSFQMMKRKLVWKT